MFVALCAAKTRHVPGDIYLGDSEDHALRQKFLKDYESEGLLVNPHPPLDQERIEMMLALERG